MAGALAPARSVRAASSNVRTLSPEDVPALRMPDGRSSRALRHALERHPGRSVWVPATLEYAQIGSWRNRPEIASVDELVAVRHVEPLLQAALERCVALGDELLLAIDLETYHGHSRFERGGFEFLEEVITYEINTARLDVPPTVGARLLPVDADDARAKNLLFTFDQAAFPWLWRNSRAEFDVYLRTPGVVVSLVEVDDAPVGYVGATLFPGWGHLDRIAVAPHRQGVGLGRAALGLTIASMRRQGARRVALSTQRTNRRSQWLYERFGFRRTPELDYQLYGAWCGLDRDLRVSSA